ncbi:hypothetical protein ABZV80_30015 [Streptomyces sp. NPDC005132]|uniref:hypothetical protein n=1 Tax=Streptomyces sp. NPDC005132 TaxID=3154294 RepID=UPI0033A540CC
MADKAEILLQFWLEQRNQARQTEAQRATMTNIILLVVAAALGFAATRGLDQRSTLLVSLPMVGMGIFGAVISTKNYERYALHITYAQRLRVQLDQLEPTLRIMDEWTPPASSTMPAIPGCTKFGCITCGSASMPGSRPAGWRSPSSLSCELLRDDLLCLGSLRTCRSARATCRY